MNVRTLIFAAVAALSFSQAPAHAAPNRQQLQHLTCQATNSLGTAAIGLGSAGDVTIQTTSVIGARTDSYTIRQVARALQKRHGSYLHLINKDQTRSSVVLEFTSELVGDGLLPMVGYLFAVPAGFDPAKVPLPTVPVAFVRCSVALR